MDRRNFVKSLFAAMTATQVPWVAADTLLDKPAPTPLADKDWNPRWLKIYAGSPDNPGALLAKLECFGDPADGDYEGMVLNTGRATFVRVPWHEGHFDAEIGCGRDIVFNTQSMIAGDAVVISDLKSGNPGGGVSP